MTTGCHTLENQGLCCLFSAPQMALSCEDIGMLLIITQEVRREISTRDLCPLGYLKELRSSKAFLDHVPHFPTYKHLLGPAHQHLHNLLDSTCLYIEERDC